MDVVSLAIALKAAGKTAEQIKAALDEYLEENPEALDQAAVEAIVGEALASQDAKLDNIENAVEDLEAGSLSALGATSGQVPTADGAGSWEWATPSGGGGVTDVQVGGTSVVTDGVANVPKAADAVLGVVSIRTNGSLGLNISRSGELRTDPATVNDIKGGTYENKPITPFRQHNATFYGLAKAAGDTTQSKSSNPAGTYTDSAIDKILAMLGVSALIGPTEGAQASQAYAIGDAFIFSGKLYKATAAIAQNDAIVPDTNCEQTTIIDMLKGA